MPSPSLSRPRGSPGSLSKTAFASAQVAKAIQLHSATHSVTSVEGGRVGVGSSSVGGGGSSVDDGGGAVGAKVGIGGASAGVCSNASVGVASRSPAGVDVASGATAVTVGVCSPAVSPPSPAHPLATVTPTTNIEYASAANRMSALLLRARSAAIVCLGEAGVNGASLAALRSAVVFPSVLVITKAEPSSA